MHCISCKSIFHFVGSFVVMKKDEDLTQPRRVCEMTLGKIVSVLGLWGYSSVLGRWGLYV